MTLPRSATLVGLVVALAAVVMDPANIPMLVQLFGEHAATKVAAIGAILAAFGRAITQKPAD